MGRAAFDFAGESVLVTGASRGIGYAVARGFAQAGAEVTILSSGSGIHQAAARIAEETGRACAALECDITDSAAVKSALAGMGRIDVLVNNAGLERITPLLDADDAVEETFRRITDINTNGTFYVTRHAVPKMAQGGRIILTASIWSRVVVAEFSAYIASKHANLGLHAGDGKGTWAAGHPGECGLPRLGAHRSRHAVAQEHVAAHRTQ